MPPVVEVSFDQNTFPTLTPFPHPLQTSLMPVVHSIGEVSRSVGTCFAISNTGLAITARHVIEDAYPLVSGSPASDLSVDKDGTFDVIYLNSDIPVADPTKVAGGRFPISRAWFNPKLDIAIIKIDLKTERKTNELAAMPAFRLSPGIPKVGQACHSAGYHAMEWDADVKNKTYRINQTLSATVGKVDEVYFPLRDTANLSFPCCRTDARFEGGMSGSPVFNSAGDVFGVVCSSLSTVGTETHTSFVSLIGPALCTSINDTDASSEGEVCLFELIDRGFVLADYTYRKLSIVKDKTSCVIDFPEDLSAP